MRRQHKPSTTYLLVLLLSTCFVLLAANLWRLSQPSRPDPRMVGLAVRATLYAIPSPTPRVVEVTRVVQVVVEVTAPPPATMAASATPTPTLAVTATPTPASTDASAAPASEADTTFVELAQGADKLSTRQMSLESDLPEPAVETAASAAEAAPAAAPQPATASNCPQSSANQYATIPVAGGGIDHQDIVHADLNLAVRGYTPTDVAADLFNKDGPVDGDPPQLAGMFGDFRRPPFGQSFRVYDWDWNCGGDGCRGGLVETGATTLLTLRSNPGESLGIPHRGAQIYGGGYKAMVLYAESNRITLGYTRADTVADGYVVHLEAICVDPNLVALYQSSNAAGRSFLPALREDESLGMSANGQVLVAVRDRGVFFDPRSRLDWWQGF